MGEQNRGDLPQPFAHGQMQRGLLGQQTWHVDVGFEFVDEHTHQMEVP